MTKLMQWLCFLATFIAVWWALLTDRAPVALSPAAKEVVFASPVYLLIVFACYSVAVVGYRTATFTDCVGAWQELKQEIEEAKKDLSAKGFKFT